MSQKNELPAFTLKDFAAYEVGRQRDPEYNGYRLAVRRKLGAHGKALQKTLKKEIGLSLTCRTSLSHPYKFNCGRVNAQWTYLSRSPKDKKALTSLVGAALAADVDTHYIQTTLVMSVDADGLEQALRIHALAWWDGINLKNRVSCAAELAAWRECLNALPSGFLLFMDRWKKEYQPGRLTDQELRAYFTSYTPGEHWLNLRRRIPKELAAEMGTDLAGFSCEGILALAPAYRYVCWSEDNDWLFDQEGRIRHDWPRKN